MLGSNAAFQDAAATGLRRSRGTLQECATLLLENSRLCAAIWHSQFPTLWPLPFHLTPLRCAGGTVLKMCQKAQLSMRLLPARHLISSHCRNQILRQDALCSVAAHHAASPPQAVHGACANVELWHDISETLRGMRAGPLLPLFRRSEQWRSEQWGSRTCQLRCPELTVRADGAAENPSLRWQPRQAERTAHAEGAL